MPSPLAHGRRSASGLLSNLASPRAPQSRSRSNSSTAVEYSEEEGLMSHTQDPHSCEGDAVCNSPSAPGGHHFPSTQIPSSASAGQHQSERPVFSNPFDMPFNINYAGVRSSHAPCLGLRDMRRGSALPPHCLREKHAQVVLEAAVDRRRASIDVAALTARSGGVPQPLAVRRGSKRLRTYQDSDDEFQNTNDFLAKNMQALSRESMLVTCFRFADHLTALLNHSLSLASGRGETSLDLFIRGKDLSPVDSVFIHEDGSSIDSAAMSSPGSLTDAFAEQHLSPETALSGSPTALNHFQQFRVKRRSSVPALDSTRRARLVKMIGQWEFNALSLDAEELHEASVLVFECIMRMEGVHAGISLERMGSLLKALQSAYHARNGYHNFTHATDVLQATYSFLNALELVPPMSILLNKSNFNERWSRPAHVEATGGIGQVLRPMDVFSLMVAAMGHDVGHPGLSNAYMVNARTPVAQVYGDKSVLENFHTVTLVQMLRKYGLGHLFGAADKCPTDSDGDCRKVLFASVLATDMSQHFPFVAKLQELANRTESYIRTPEEVEADRLLLCCGMMKCADISNPSRPHHIARDWSTALLQEWSVQAKIEEEFKLPVSVMILNPAEAKAQAKSQVGFINLFTQPLFDAMAAILPALDQFSKRCKDGRRIWEQIVLQAEDHIAKTPTPPPTPATKAVQHRGPAITAGSRRRPPPRPLNFGLRTRGSHDSTASSGPLSPGTPSSLISPVSFVSTAASSVASPVLGVRSQCTGQCAITEKCLSCLRAETKGDTSAQKPMQSVSSDDPLIHDQPSGTTTPTEQLELCDTWPPFPFYPTSTT